MFQHDHSDRISHRENSLQSDSNHFNQVVKETWGKHSDCHRSWRHHGSGHHDALMQDCGLPTADQVLAPPSDQQTGVNRPANALDQTGVPSTSADQPAQTNDQITNDSADTQQLMQEIVQLEQELLQVLRQLFGLPPQGSDNSAPSTGSDSGAGSVPAQGGGGDIPAPQPATGGDQGPQPKTGDNPAQNIPHMGGETTVPADAKAVLAGAEIPPLPADAINAKEKFGAKGDGSTDDTKALQAAVDACPPGGTVYVPDGTYMIDTQSSLRLKSGVTLQMSDGAVLKAIPSDAQSGSIVNIEGVQNVNVYGGTIEGDRFSHKSNLGECLYGIGIYGAQHVNIVGVTSKDNFGDGFCIDSFKSDPNLANSADINFSHDVGVNNRRDGMSIVGVNGMHVTASAFMNNGGNDSIDPTVPECPQLPMAGIDIEPDAGKTTVNVLIDHNLIKDNATDCDNVYDNGNGFGLRLTGGNGTDTGNQIIDNVIQGNKAGGVGVWVGDHTISGNQIIEDKNGYVVYQGSAGGEGNTLNGAAATPTNG